MSNSSDRLFPPTADDFARMEHRARAACETATPGSHAYRLAIDVLRLLDERTRLLSAGVPDHEG
jgi:hypothetical protein